MNYKHFRQALTDLGISLIGKKAQSNLLTQIGNKGQKELQPPQKIIGFEIIDFPEREPALMVEFENGESIYENLLINIK